MPADPTPTIPHNPSPDPTPGSGPTPTFDPEQTAELAAPPAAIPASGVSTVPTGGGGAGTPVPGYELLGELGRGGMGVVLRARHLVLGRLVALKLMLGTRATGRPELIRFLAEAEAVAAVRHPGVVQVYDYGEADGRPYMALELLPGGTLTDHIKQNERLEPTAAAEVVGKVARGVAAAHAVGIVHRDLKPHNILFAEDGEPKVTDFGLAKRGSGAELTQTGILMGTPAYMAPEQAAGGAKFVGPPADVWAIGVILYECLAGQRPFRANSTHELLAQIINSPPASLTVTRRPIPRDLSLIYRKCLEKSPADRYPTATELAEDLERFVRGEPISVRPAGPAERLFKWARRKPTAAAAVVLGVLAVVAGGFGTLAAVERQNAVEQQGIAEGERARAEIARAEADARRAEAETAKVEAVARRAEAEAASQVAEKERNKAQVAQVREEVARKESEALRAAREVDLSYREWAAGTVRGAAQRLDMVDSKYRDWEWRYTRRLCDRGPTVLAVASGHMSLSPDGKKILLSHVASGLGPMVQRFDVFDVANGERVPCGLPPQGMTYATASMGARNPRILFLGPDPAAKDKFIAQVADPFNPATNKTIGGIPPRATSIRCASVGGDASRFALLGQDRKVRVWDVATGTLRETLDVGFPPQATFNEIVMLSDDGTVLACADRLGMPVRLIGVATGKELTLPVRQGTRFTQTQFLADGRVVLFSETGLIACFSLSAPDKAVFMQDAPAIVRQGTVSPDGERMATGSDDGRVRVWELSTGRLVLSLPPLYGKTGSLAWASGGKRLMVGGADRLIREWSVDTGDLLGTYRGVDQNVTSLAVLPDGRILAPGSVGVVAFESGRSVESTSLGGYGGSVSPDGRLLALAMGNPQPQTVISELATGATLATIPAAARFSPDGRLLSTDRDKLQIWNPRTGQELEKNTLPSPFGFLPGSTLTTNGDAAVASRVEGDRLIYQLHDLNTDDEPRKLFDLPLAKGGFGTGRGIRFDFSPDGREVVSCEFDQVFPTPPRRSELPSYRVWDARTGTLLRKVPLPPLPTQDVQLFAPSREGEANLSVLLGYYYSNGQQRFLAIKLDLKQGKEVVRLDQLTGDGTFLGFSPDGGRALIGAPGGEIRVLSLALKQQVFVLSGHREMGGVANAQFSSDGKFIISRGYANGGVKVWDGR